MVTNVCNMMFVTVWFISPVSCFGSHSQTILNSLGIRLVALLSCVICAHLLCCSVQNNPLHFTCVIVDEVSLLPLMYLLMVISIIHHSCSLHPHSYLPRLPNVVSWMYWCHWDTSPQSWSWLETLFSCQRPFDLRRLFPLALVRASLRGFTSTSQSLILQVWPRYHYRGIVSDMNAMLKYEYWCGLLTLENPVKMLQVQYRMLPEICQFPSDHFYHSKLKTSRYEHWSIMV